MSINVSTIVVGVDPAPSKGLCVYAYDPQTKPKENAGFERHYDSTTDALKRFSRKVNELAKNHAVLICWDAPLTMPSRFYEREIEKIAKPMKPQNQVKGKTKDENKREWDSLKPNLASVQPATNCSHWAITQRVLGYPSFENKRLGNSLLEVKLIFNNKDIDSPGVYLTEVHPALAIQITLGREYIKDELNDGGKLSGKQSYKNVTWNKLRNFDFQKLLNDVVAKLGSDKAKLEDLTECPTLDPSDHLDAWVAMRLGMLWLEGVEVELYGNSNIGSFLLPSGTSAAHTERYILKNIREKQ